MSGFSTVNVFLPGDEAGLGRWLLEHYVEHQNFYRALLEATPPVETTNLPIQRIDNIEAWLAAHQRMSQSVWTGIGGGQSTDFERVDWDNKGQLQDWLQTHALWHSQVRDSLNL